MITTYLILFAGSASAVGGQAGLSDVLSVVRVGDDCSGVLVAPTRVATAAHCVLHSNVASVDGVAVIELTTDETHDLAVLILDRPLGLTVASLVTSQPLVGSRGILVGYGMTEKEKPGDRRQGELMITRYDSDTLWADGQARACGGDSGGALMINGQLAGITLEGDPFCQGQYHDTGFVTATHLATLLSRTQ